MQSSILQEIKAVFSSICFIVRPSCLFRQLVNPVSRILKKLLFVVNFVYFYYLQLSRSLTVTISLQQKKIYFISRLDWFEYYIIIQYLLYTVLVSSREFDTCWISTNRSYIAEQINKTCFAIILVQYFIYILGCLFCLFYFGYKNKIKQAQLCISLSLSTFQYWQVLQELIIQK
jgi:hypothetical protein